MPSGNWVAYGASPASLAWPGTARTPTSIRAGTSPARSGIA